MGRLLSMCLIGAFLMAATAFAAPPADSQSFHPERYGREIEFDKVDRYSIQWTVNFQDFLDDQTRQLRLEIEKFKPVKFVREAPLSTTERGTLQIEPIHYPSVQLSAARW